MEFWAENLCYSVFNMCPVNLTYEVSVKKESVVNLDDSDPLSIQVSAQQKT